MKNHNDIQLEKFIKLKQKYGEYVRVKNMCVFRSKSKAYSVNIDLNFIVT